MRVFGCLIWFDEDPRWLANTVASLAKICDHVVAVDGAFFAFPEGRAASGGEQGEAIQAAARTAGIGCTLHVPQSVWMGNEPEKRSCYTRLVNALAEPFVDWMLVLDGDEELSEVSPLARRDLERTDLNAAQIGFWTTDELRSWFGPTRRLYRVLPHMEYVGCHYSLRAWTDERGSGWVWLDGRGPQYGEPLEDALDLTTQIRVEHKHHLRPAARTAKADVFMNLRPQLEPWVEV